MIVLTVDGKDTTYAVAKEASILAFVKNSYADVAGGLSGLKTGDDASATVENKEGKDVVTRIVMGGAAKKKKTKQGYSPIDLGHPGMTGYAVGS